ALDFGLWRLRVSDSDSARRRTAPRPPSLLLPRPLLSRGGSSLASALVDCSRGRRCWIGWGELLPKFASPSAGRSGEGTRPASAGVERAQLLEGRLARAQGAGEIRPAEESSSKGGALGL
ncbi:hypothetical protein ACHAXT_009543, partial [Thalassiosira profunda]